MPGPFFPVPNWFSFENQGAGLAAADLSGNGRPDLVVFMVDAPPGQVNRGLFRVARDLDAAGQPLGGYTAWLDVPQWTSFENQGAGIALADLENHGAQDLIVLRIDNPAGQNAGFYRVGKSLDANGNVAGGWQPWRAIPNWFPFENQFGGIAVADLDGNGNLDLIVMMIDGPVGQNQGYFSIGRKLDGLGVVTGGWTNWIPIPGWFSWENQGGGVAVADLGNAGRADVIFFQVDDAATQNQGFYRIARGLRANGTVAAGWTPWLGVPGWFSWMNQGAAIASVSLRALGGNPSHDLAILAVDSPAGVNGGYLQFLGLDEVPAERGRWEVLPFDSQLLAVHAAVLPKGDVMFFAGSGNNSVRFFSPDFGNIAHGVACSVVWDYAASAADGLPHFTFPPTPMVAGKPYDFFCGGETMLADGRLIAAGGTKRYDTDAHNQPTDQGFAGRRDVFAYDRTAGKWVPLAAMAGGRWYPTLITLGDGRVLAASGLDENGNLNGSLEIFTPNAGAGTWQTLLGPAATAGFEKLPQYCHLFLLRDGRIFFSGGRMDDETQASAGLLDLTHNPVRFTPLAGLAFADARNQSATVLLAPAQAQKFLIIGGTTYDGEENATDSVDTITLQNIAGPLPGFQRAAPLLLPRVHLNAVLLPDHTVFVGGGALQREGGPTERRKLLARFQAEIYDPLADRWTLAATAEVERLYHSVALLLPDGRVAASGNPDKGGKVKWGQNPFNEELRLEIYSPSYLFRGARPTITAVVEEWTYGQTIDIHSPEAGHIRWATLMRNSVTTHSFNTNQRAVDLDIASQAAGVVRAKIAAEPNVAPPGWYMLFLVANDGVPSVARWIHLT